jgi:hypothetical protein
MLKNRLRHLGNLMLLGSLIACFGPGKVYTILSEPFMLKDGNIVTKAFDLPVVKSSRSIDLTLVHDNVNDNTGRFRVNGHPFVDFQIDRDDSLPDGLSQVAIFSLPRKWFKATQNIIELEHLSGAGLEILFIRLEYNDLDKSPYEE